MVLPTSGALSLGQIATEYSDSQPNSMSEFYRGGSLVPTTVSGSATQAAPSTDGTYSDFGGVTGLTLVRSAGTTDSGFVLRRNLTGSGGPVNFYVSPGNGSTRITDLELRTTGNARVCVSTSQQTSCSPTLGTKTLNNYTQVGSYNYRSNDGTVKEYARVRTSFTLYTFTNNTGFNVTIEGTTIANGASSAIDPSGDYNISFTVNANPNVPASGTIDFADFYGGRAS